MTQYGSIDYWDDRYSEDKEPFEFYQRYSGIRHFLTPKYLCLDKLESKQSDGPELLSDNQAVGDADSDDCTKHKPSFPAAKDTRVLILGCGNSEVGAEMLADGFTNQICNVDYSSVVIRQMNQKYNDEWYQKLNWRIRCERRMNDGNHAAGEDGTGSTKWVLTGKRSHGSPSPPVSKNKPGRRATAVAKTSKSDKNPQCAQKLLMSKMLFQVVDVTKSLPYPDQSYDLIFCKGTFDAILCAPKRLEKIKIMMKECHRVLENNHGVMMIVSYGDPENRLGIMEAGEWRKVKTFRVPKPVVPATVATEGIGVLVLNI